MRISPVLRLMLLVPVLAACIGRATPPEQVKLTQQQNEVLGKFARQVGEKEINILLKDPDDATLPGIPVGDLLYILSKVNEDKLITLVKGIGATSTLELILAIKRVGCTRVNNIPVPAAYSFDARSVTSINSCKWNHFHLPNIMVQLLNGANTNGLSVLIDTVKHSYTNLPALSALPNQPLYHVITPGPVTLPAPYQATVRHYEFLLKIAYIAVGFDTPTAADPNLSSENLIGPPKLYNLMNLTLDGRDMVFLLDSFDRNFVEPPGVQPTTCPALFTPAPVYPPPVPGTLHNCVRVADGLGALTANTVQTYNPNGDLWVDIDYGYQLSGLKNLLNVMAQVTDTSKMGTLVNGQRTTRYDTTQDDEQARYFIDRLKVLIEHTAPVAVNCPIGGPGYSFPTKSTSPAAQQDAECNLQNYTLPQGPLHVAFTTGDNAEWNKKLANLINSVTNVNRMMDFVYRIEDGYDTVTHAPISVFPSRGIDNLLVMLNNINDVATPSPHALVPANGYGNNTTNNELLTAAHLIDNVALDPTNVILAKRNKVKYLVENIGTSLDVLNLSCYTAVADNNTGGSQVCDNRGMINQAAAGSKVNDTPAADLTAAGQKLVNLMGQVNEIEDMRFLVRKVKMKPLTDLIAGLMISGTANTANLINQVTGTDCWDTGTSGPMRSGPLGAIITTPGTYTADVRVNFTDGTCVTGASGNCATGKGLVNSSGGIGPVIVLSETGFTVSPYYYTTNPTVTFASGAAVATYTGGRCFYDGAGNFRGFPSGTSTGATGLGKMVNIVNHLSGSITNLVTLINNVTDGQKLGIMINGIGRSSNLVGVMNATVDATRGNLATITDMVTLINTISRTDTHKLVHLIDNVGNAIEANTTDTAPSGDHDLIAQLLSPYNGANVTTTSGLGPATMAQLIQRINLSTGGALSNGSINLNNAPGTGATGQISVDNAGAITEITMTDTVNYPLAHPGGGCTSVPTISILGGGGSGAQATVVMGPDTGTPAPAAVPFTMEVQRVNIISGGSGYTGPFEVTFSGGGCATPPRGWAVVNGIGSIAVTNGGAGYLSSFNVAITGVGATQASARVIVSGTIAGTGSLTNIYPGTDYVTGQICPITGAGGLGGTCTVTAAGGALTSCSAIAGGASYADGRIVKIGGAAQAYAIVSGGVITSVIPLNNTETGCGYSGTPLVQVAGCTTAPNITANPPVAGRITGYNVVFGGSGCPLNPKVSVGEFPYQQHSDGASAIISGVTGGVVTSVSMSEASVYLAQLLTITDRDGSGQGRAINLNNAAGLLAAGHVQPNISTREAMVRLLYAGADYDPDDADGPGPGVDGPLPNYSFPGVGPDYIAASILNNLSGTQSTQALINLLNADNIALNSTLLLLGCGDRVTFSGPLPPNTFQTNCTALNIW